MADLLEQPVVGEAGQQLQIVPLFDLQNNPQYQQADNATRRAVFSAWRRETQELMNERGLWDPQTSLEFEIETRREDQRTLGVEPLSPQATFEVIQQERAEADKSSTLDNIFAMLDEVQAAERESRKLDRSRFFTIGDETLIDMGVDKQGKLIESATSKAGGNKRIKEARAAKEALEGKRDSAVVDGVLFVNPDLYLDKEAFVKAVNKSTALRDERMATLANFDAVQEQIADNLAEQLRSGAAGHRFIEFANKITDENPDASVVEVVKAYKDSGAAVFDRVTMGVLRGALQGVEGVSFLAAALGDIGADIGIPGAAAVGEAGFAVAGEFAEAKQNLARDIAERGGQTGAEKILETGVALVPQLAQTIVSGGVIAGLNKAATVALKKKLSGQLASNLASKNLKKVATSQFANRKLALNEFTNLINRRVTPFGVGYLSSAGPKFYEAYERERENLAGQGLVGEKLEEAARVAAFSDANRTGLITGAITSMFGLRGVEGVGRLFQIANSPTARLSFSQSIKKFIGKTALEAGGESFEEALDEGINGGLDALLTNPDMTFEEWGEAVLFAGTAGGILGGAVAAPVNAAEIAMQTATEQIRNSPQMEVRRNAVQTLRDQGMDEVADAMEANNDAAETQAITESAGQIEEDIVGKITRLNEVDNEISTLEGQGELSGEQAAQLDSLRTEQGNLQQDLEAPAPPLAADADPHVIANQARSILVDQGIDEVTAGQQIRQVVVSGQNITELSPTSLATLAQEPQFAAPIQIPEAIPQPLPPEAEPTPVVEEIPGQPEVSGVTLEVDERARRQDQRARAEARAREQITRQPPVRRGNDERGRSVRQVATAFQDTEAGVEASLKDALFAADEAALNEVPGFSALEPSAQEEIRVLREEIPRFDEITDVSPNLSLIAEGGESRVHVDPDRPGVIVKETASLDGEGTRFGGSGTLEVINGEVIYTPQSPFDPNSLNGDLLSDIISQEAAEAIPSMVPSQVVGVIPSEKILITEQPEVDIDAATRQEVREHLRQNNPETQEVSLVAEGQETPEPGILSRGDNGKFYLMLDVLSNDGNATIEDGEVKIIDAFVFEVTDEMFAANEDFRNARELINLRLGIEAVPEAAPEEAPPVAPTEIAEDVVTPPPTAPPTPEVEPPAAPELDTAAPAPTTPDPEETMLHNPETPKTFHDDVAKSGNWENSVTRMVETLIEGYPQVNATIDTDLPVPARSVGDRIFVNPTTLAEMTEGMYATDAKAVVEKVFIHEAIHKGAVADIGEAEVLRTTTEMTTDEREDVARAYLANTVFESDEAFYREVSRMAGNDPTIGDAERQQALLRLGHEHLRMTYERLTSGQTTEETIAFLQMNPGVLARVINYLNAALKRLRATWQARLDPDLHSMMDRLDKNLWKMREGNPLFFVHPGEAPFVVEEATEEQVPSTFNTVLGRDLALDTPLEDLTATEQELNLDASPSGRKQRSVLYKGGTGTYQPGGLFSAAFKWDRRLFKELEKSRGKGAAAINRAEQFGARINRALKKTFGKDWKAQLPIVNQALGNTDNRLTQTQADELARIKRTGLSAARSAYLTERARANQLDNTANLPGAVAPENLRNQASRVREDAKNTFDDAVAEYKLDAQSAELGFRATNRQIAKAAVRDAQNSFPEDIRDMIREMRVRIDLAGRELRRLGFIDGDLKVTIDENRGLWLHRSYKIFDQDNYAEWLRSEDPEASVLRNNASNYIRSALVAEQVATLRAGGMPLDQATAQAKAFVTDDAMRERLHDYMAVADDGAKSLLQGGSSIPIDIIKKRQVVPRAIRELWGEHEDPIVNAAKSLAAVTQFVETQKFLETVRQLGLAEGWLSEAHTDAQGNRLVPLFDNHGMVGRFNNTPNPRYAPLAGLNGPPALREALGDSVRKEQGPVWAKFLVQLTGYSMMTKTVFSWMATMRNFLGNVLPIVMNGYLTWHTPKRFKNAFLITYGNLAKRGDKALRDKITRAVELNLVGDSNSENVIRELTNGFKSDKKAVTWFEKLVEKIFFTKILKKGVSGITSFYGAQDDIWKIVAHESELAKVKRYRKDSGMTLEQMEVEAADIVLDVMPSFSRAVEAVRLIRRLPFMAPYVTFGAEVYRTTINIARIGIGQTVEGIKTGNTELAKAGAERMFGTAVATGGLLGFTMFIRHMAGFDDEDEEDLRQHVPYWEENSTLVLLPTGKPGEIDYWNVSYMNPYDYWQRPMRAFFRGITDPDSGVLDTAKATLSELFDPVAKEQILFGSIVDSLRGVTNTGRNVWDRTDPGAKKIWLSLDHVYKSAVEPGTLASIERIRKAWKGEVTPSGRSFDFNNEFYGGIFGVKVSSVNTSTTLEFAARQFSFDRRDAASTFTRRFRSAGTQSDAEIVNSYLDANEKLKTSFQTLRRKMVSSIRLGKTSPQEAVAIMKANRVSQRLIADVLNNRYIRYQPTKATIDLGRLQGRARGQDRVSLMRQAMALTPPQEPLSEDDDF